MDDTKQANSIILLRKRTLEFFAVTLLIALGINFTASGISSWFSLTDRTNTIIGISIIFVCCAYLAIRSGIKKHRIKRIDGVFLIDDANGDIVTIYRYDFAEELEQIFKAARAENRALFRTWKNVDLNKEQVQDNNFLENASSKRVIVEMVEYFIISKLSLHLNSYFIENELRDDEEIVTLDRNKIPEILLQNRILELFSRPMEDREAFSDSDHDLNGGKIILSYGDKGEIFDHFEMELPKRTTFTRDSDGNLNVNTPRFTITIKIVFEGMNEVMPRDFEELYLKKEFLSISALSVKVIILTNFSIRSLLTGKGWEYYLWLDSYIDSLEKSFSFKKFIESIGWEHTLTTIIASSNVKSRKHRAETDAKALRPMITKTKLD